MNTSDFAWMLDPPPGLRQAYEAVRRTGNAERLRVAAVIILLMFSALTAQHFLSPGLPLADPDYPLYLGIYICFIAGSLAYLLLLASKSRRDSVPAQWSLVLLILGGTTCLGILDYAVSGDLTALLLGLLAVSVFFRCRLPWFVLSAAGVVSAFVLGSWLMGGRPLSPGVSVPLVIDAVLAVIFSVALGHYEIRTFTLRMELESANARQTEEIGAKERAAEDLRKALADRAALFQELQHRVKNSLGMVSSLLSLDQQRQEEGPSRRMLAEAQGRIHTIAAIYECLYRSGELESVDFALYAADFIDMFLRVNAEETGRIRISRTLAPLRLDLQRAIPLGLVMNELLTNAFKHAFPDGRAGTVSVELETMPGRALLRIRDDGIGLPEGYSPHRSGSLGMTLVDLLVGQIGAEKKVCGGPGFGLEIAFTL